MESSRNARYSVQALFSLILILVGFWIGFESLHFSLPLIEKGQATVLDMPGLSPLLCACMLIILAGFELFAALRRGGTIHYFFSRTMISALTSAEAKIVYKVFGILGLYVFVLLPFLPYLFSTTLFLLLFMSAFGAFFSWKESWKSLLISLLITITLWCIFEILFSVNLPKGILGG